MVAILVSAPLAEPVSRDEAKTHARIDGAAEDDIVDRLLRAARADIENRCSRALMRQSWRVVRDKVPSGGVVRLAPAPVISVDAVTLYGADGSPQVIDPSEYEVDLASTPGRLRLNAGRFWGARSMNGLEVDFTAGYASAADVPEPLKQAILMLFTYWFEQREACAMGAVVGPVAHAVSSLVAPYRMQRLA